MTLGALHTKTKGKRKQKEQIKNTLNKINSNAVCTKDVSDLVLKVSSDSEEQTHTLEAYYFKVVEQPQQTTYLPFHD